jgi:DNA repair exonuclease SbcCD nuclease subunit
MKFAHIADAHLGGWRDPKMRDVNTKSFITAIDRIISEQVDFLIIAGDLFNTSLPAMECLKTCVQKLKEVKDAGIPIYIIPGSHDYSPSGKTILDVLEETGLFKNVMRGEITEEGKLKLKFTVDEKTGVKFTGILGKRGGLEKKYYEDIERENLENEPGKKIFLFHSAINELKPKELADMDAMEASLLPKGFDYYAGGHVHIIQNISLEGRPNIVYPGPIFPNSFSEIEKLKHGTFVIWNEGKVNHIPIIHHPTVALNLNVEGLTPNEVELLLAAEIKRNNFQNAIVTLRVSGVMKHGKPTDVNLSEYVKEIQEKGAYAVLKNTVAFSTKEFEQVTVSKHSTEDIETTLIQEHVGKSGVYTPEKESSLIKSIMHSLSVEKDEGEKLADFQKRVKEEIKKILV